jgi:hypothetical protein
VRFEAPYGRALPSPARSREGRMSALCNGLRGNVVALAATALAFALVAPARATAQSFVPPKGDGAVAILYQNQFVERHSLDDGSPLFAGATRTQVLAIDFTYGLTDRLALNLSVPFVTSDYLGQFMHREAQFGRTSAIDPGGYYGTVQDFRLNLRYNAINRGGGAVTPYVSVLVPVHDYDYFGHNAAGRRLTEVQLGAYVGRALDRLPGLFVQGRYGYALPQSVAGHRVFRSQWDGEVAYFVRQTLRVFGVVTGQVSHGGVRFVAANFFEYVDADEKIHHDRISRINYFNLGGGAQWALSPTLDVFGSIMRTMSMTNGHVMEYGVTAGVSWSFSRGTKTPGTVAGRTEALVKCLCMKGQ